MCKIYLTSLVYFFSRNFSAVNAAAGLEPTTSDFGKMAELVNSTPSYIIQVCKEFYIFFLFLKTCLHFNLNICFPHYCNAFSKSLTWFLSTNVSSWKTRTAVQSTKLEFERQFGLKMCLYFCLWRLMNEFYFGLFIYFWRKFLPFQFFHIKQSFQKKIWNCIS